MVQIPAGDFMMGALEDDEDAYDQEKTRHKVTLTRDFFMGKYSVTQALWESVMGSNPSDFKGANRPVECVSWFDCVLFCLGTILSVIWCCLLGFCWLDVVSDDSLFAISCEERCLLKKKQMKAMEFK